MRLDIFLKERNYFESRKKAQDAIKDGLVKVNNKVAKKTSVNVDEDSLIEIDNEKVLNYVSRAALKLLAGKREFKVDFQNKIVLDLGASTGGFTEVALEAGAKKVYAVDVGTAQLHSKIKNDKRVVNLEKTDARHLTIQEIPEKIDIVVADLSFISIFKVLPEILEFTKPETEFLILFKPQFEVGRKHIGKNGIVTDAKAIKKSLTQAKKKFQRLHFQDY